MAAKESQDAASLAEEAAKEAARARRIELRAQELDLNREGAPGAHPALDELVQIIWRLRQPDGCPWDREQTHASIAKNLVEEAYETLDCIEDTSQVKARHLSEELGDVLMQVVLQSQIASDNGEFTIDDVAEGVSTKLIRRHPHVFGDLTAANARDVLNLWDKVKLAEHANDAAQATEAGVKREGLLDSVPNALPALMMCQKISRKAVAAGFDWESLEGVWDQVYSEIAEFRDAEPNSSQAEMEFGDILFSLVNIARWCHIDAESALRASCAKFRARWSDMEEAAWAQGTTVEALSRDEQETLWVEAKQKEMRS